MRIKIGNWFEFRRAFVPRRFIPLKGWMCNDHQHIFYWWKYALEIGAPKDGK
jgi:hypothetical protein